MLKNLVGARVVWVQAARNNPGGGEIPSEQEWEEPNIHHQSLSKKLLPSWPKKNSGISCKVRLNSYNLKVRGMITLSFQILQTMSCYPQM